MQSKYSAQDRNAVLAYFIERAGSPGAIVSSVVDPIGNITNQQIEGILGEFFLLEMVIFHGKVIGGFMIELTQEAFIFNREGGFWDKNLPPRKQRILNAMDKDRLLEYYIQLGPIENQRYVSRDVLVLDFTHGELVAMLKHFERLGLIESEGATLDGSFLFRIQAEAHDLINRGGFEVQEFMLAKNLSELIKELDEFKHSGGPSDKSGETLSKIEKIVSIGTNLITAIAAAKGMPL